MTTHSATELFEPLPPRGYYVTLAAVRELAERATLRRAPKRLRLVRPTELKGPQPAKISFEELHPPKIGGAAGTAGNYKPRVVRPIPSAWAQIA